MAEGLSKVIVTHIPFSFQQNCGNPSPLICHAILPFINVVFLEDQTTRIPFEIIGIIFLIRYLHYTLFSA